MNAGSLGLFLESVAHNRFQDKIQVHRTPLGSARRVICVHRVTSLEGVQVPW